MKVIIAQGEKLEVEVADSDGRFTIEYGPRIGGTEELTVHADLPGSHVGTERLIYREVYAGCTCERQRGCYEVLKKTDPKCPDHGLYSAKATKAEIERGVGDAEA